MGFDARKASMNFIAEELAGLGWQTDFVTTQLSLFSVLARVPRLEVVPRKKRNTWIDCGENLSAFVWVPAFHPATGGAGLITRMTAPLAGIKILDLSQVIAGPE